jgi:hypothetical protein
VGRGEEALGEDRVYFYVEVFFHLHLFAVHQEDPLRFRASRRPPARVCRNGRPARPLGAYAQGTDQVQVLGVEPALVRFFVAFRGANHVGFASPARCPPGKGPFCNPPSAVSPGPVALSRALRPPASSMSSLMRNCLVLSSPP